MKFILALGLLFLSAPNLFSQHTAEAATGASKIKWMSFEEAFALHQTNPKKWLIDVSTEWCGWCKRMDQTTFSDSLIVDHVNANFYAVALDGEFKGDIVIGDRTYSFVAQGQRGYHELPAELMNGKMSYPTIVFLGENLENLSAVPGYKDAPSFYQIVSFFETYHPTKNPITWDDFSRAFVSPYPAPVEIGTN